MGEPFQREKVLSIDIGAASTSLRDYKLNDMSLAKKFSPLYISGQADDKFYASFGQQHRPNVSFLSSSSDDNKRLQSLRFTNVLQQPLNTLSTQARCYIDKLSDVQESATERAVAFLRAYESQLELLLNSYNPSTSSSGHATYDSSELQSMHIIHRADSTNAILIDIAKASSFSNVLYKMREDLTMLVSIVSTFYPSVPTSIQSIVQSITEYANHLEDQCGLSYKDTSSIMDTDTTNTTPPTFIGPPSHVTMTHISTLDGMSKISINGLDQGVYTPIAQSARLGSANMAHTLFSKPRSIVKVEEWNDSYERSLALRRSTNFSSQSVLDKPLEPNTGGFNLFNEPPESSERDKGPFQTQAKNAPAASGLSKLPNSTDNINKNISQDVSHIDATSESAENVDENANSILLEETSSELRSTSDILTLTKICSVPGLLSKPACPQAISTSTVGFGIVEDLSESVEDKAKKSGAKPEDTNLKPFTPATSSPDTCKYVSEEYNQRVADKKWCAFTSEEALIRSMLTFIKTFYNERIVKASNDIYVELGRRIKQGDCVLVFGKSKLILKALLLAHSRLQAETDKSACFEVVCIDAPESQCGLGLLQKLSQAGIPCFYGLLTSLPLFIQHATKIMMGAFSVSLDGSVQGRAGSSLLANIAKLYKLPVIVVCETYKITDQFYLNALSNNILQDTGLLTLSQMDKVQIIKPLYDIVSPNLIGCIITEYGAISASSLREQLK